MAFTRYRIVQPAAPVDQFGADGVPVYRIERVTVSAIRHGVVYEQDGGREPHTSDWQLTYDDAASEIRARLTAWYGEQQRAWQRRERTFYAVRDRWHYAREED